ncbi:MAG: 1,4-dihydroxy-2-naphthoate octaprenyltransferase [Bacillus thermozeamaize]|uniref:1,4-dihydroxy-2-naphthoate octaprenyltransferase n=1 Tax=Bacillus thermozeamaize TaxID=230954 RepID=A0A1Y3PVZ2_9BACI|nr:MAG: 1,4-dihydroxy-2-naphthoate octaprenyltransferase [Bacillus thermozeamaize]
MKGGCALNPEKPIIPASTLPPLPDWRVWWRQMRPHTLTASVIPVLIGTAMAMSHTAIHLPLFFAMLAASLLIQAATNLFNEYYDYKRGLDTPESVGIGGAIVRDGISPKTVLCLAILFFFIAILLGLYICANSSWWIAVVGLVSMAVGYFYTGGPYPLAYTPFGELASGFFMGPVIVLISYYIQAGTLSRDVVLTSIPVAILVGAILLSNNIRDLDSDRERGRKTLAIRLGRPKAIQLLAGMFAAAYLWTIVYALIIASYWFLLVLLSLPKAVQAIRRFRGKTKPAEMMPAMKSTAQLHTQYGILLMAGILLEGFIIIN